MKKGDIVSVVAMSGEYIGELVDNKDGIELANPKMIVQAPDGGMGFAKGVAVTIDAAHQCMTMRGIKKEKATTVTNYFLGSFKEDLSIQNRYLKYIGK